MPGTLNQSVDPVVNETGTGALFRACKDVSTHTAYPCSKPGMLVLPFNSLCC